MLLNNCILENGALKFLEVGHVAGEDKSCISGITQC